MVVTLLPLGVLLFAALVVVTSLVVQIVMVIARSGVGDAPGLGPPRPLRRHDSWWDDAARSPWPGSDGDGVGADNSHGPGHGDSSSCGSGGGSSRGGGSSSSCGSGG
ncbi:hypothetical protein [Streptomyces europaeiscabiei]|uniref:hypothetical protein n=1 Tax=Streptomyces europaeiscabiei TaxID=146819 RepID=UPI0029A2BF05|nr:hypothetical protein [Streptomyces europaeiscabiei]MDX3587513.1 hypothetical protein [Streptomyces europaeiscabiei]MDX3631773.1 hypothetical protein [Streptomyces europaeiscabiei]MDX3649554.1 hypothetical protein [Streptomyces europaeiscabiei]